MEYITLDDEVLREQVKSDPKLFLEEHPAPLLIDEVQYAPNLFSYIKINVDKENKNGMYWLKGSQQFHLMKNVSEIIKAYNARGITPNLYYYRDKEKNEIDLIFYKNNKLYPLEIKKTAIPKKEMIKSFSKLEKTKKEIGTGGIICFYDTLTKLDEKDYIIPVSNVINYSEPQD